MRQKILLVEDDNEIAIALKELLEANGYDVKIHNRGDTAEEAIAAYKPDGIILDVLLPGKNGIDICRAIRPKFLGKIFMFSALNTDEQVDEGYEAGADAYFGKVEDPVKLLARINAIMDRVKSDLHTQQPAESENLTIGALSIHKTLDTATINGRPLALAPRECQLLRFFISHINCPLDRDTLTEALLDKKYIPEDRHIDVYVHRLKNKIKPYANICGTIEAVWGKGYIYKY